MTRIREQAEQARNQPLEVVAAQLGGHRHRHDKQRWDFGDFGGCSVWLGRGENRQRFYDHHVGRGGGGAIDLVMHVLACDFKEALQFLVSNDMGAKWVTTPPRPTPPVRHTFSAPACHPQHTHRLVSFLTSKRGCPAYVVEDALERGLIYTDSRRNVVFPCYAPNGDLTGAELRGTGVTPFKGMAPGSRRGEGFFALTPTELAATKLIVVESAIDALAYQSLFRCGRSYIVSTAGIVTECPTLAELAKRLCVGDIVIGYDNDDAGEHASEKLMRSLGTHFTPRRHRPELKDWNDVMLANTQQKEVA